MVVKSVENYLALKPKMMIFIYENIKGSKNGLSNH